MLLMLYMLSRDMEEAFTATEFDSLLPIHFFILHKETTPSIVLDSNRQKIKTHSFKYLKLPTFL